MAAPFQDWYPLLFFGANKKKCRCASNPGTLPPSASATPCQLATDKEHGTHST